MIPACRTILAVLCALVWTRTGIAAPPQCSVSASRQFLVYGGDIRLRGVICDLAERTKRDLLQLVDQRDEWITPVVVNARYPQANLPEAPRAALNFAQTGFGLKLQLDLIIDLDVSQADVRRELLRVILLEMMYRRNTDLPAGAAYVAPPAWLVDGIPPFQSYFDSATLIDALRTPARARKIPPLREFLRIEGQSGIEAPSRFLYSAYSFALVDLLTHAPDGRAHLARFIAGLPFASDDPVANLGLHFPELRNPSQAAKVWSSQIERLANSQPFQSLSVEETEQKLDQFLVLVIPGPGSERKYHLDEFPRFIRKASAKAILTRLSREMSLFATRANPMYRTMVYEYARIESLLARGKTKRITGQLARLRVSRQRNAAQGRGINDYMNWFEATKSMGLSGAFTDYLRAARQTSEPERRRRDSISVYLDVLETQFEN